MSNLKGRPYNGLTGLELKAVVLKQLHGELTRQEDPAPDVDWRKKLAAEIDRVLSMDDRFRPHIAYPVIEWGWNLTVKSEPSLGVVKFAFTLKVESYPVDVAEWTVTVATGVRPTVSDGGVFPEFTAEAGFGQDYVAPDLLRKQTGLPIPGQKSTDSGRVDITADEASAQATRANEIVGSF